MEEINKLSDQIKKAEKNVSKSHLAYLQHVALHGNLLDETSSIPLKTSNSKKISDSQMKESRSVGPKTSRNNLKPQN